jgi:hypothetical protein
MDSPAAARNGLASGCDSDPERVEVTVADFSSDVGVDKAAGLENVIDYIL